MDFTKGSHEFFDGCLSVTPEPWQNTETFATIPSIILQIFATFQ